MGCFGDMRSSASLLTSGTSIIWWSCSSLSLVLSSVCSVGVERRGVRVGLPGTLLGPEGSSLDSVSLDHPFRELPVGRYRPFGVRGTEGWDRP